MIFPAGPALKEEDEAEAAAIHTVFSQSPKILSSKSLLGHLLGAEIATEMAISALMLDRQMIPSHIASSSDMSVHGSNSSMKHALILSAGLGGAYASLIVSKSD